MTTGYVYDPIFLEHTQPGHPESARRLKAVMAELESSGLLRLLAQVPSRAATLEELTYAHARSYVERVQRFSQMGGGYLDPDTYANDRTFDAATVAAGSLVDLLSAVIDGRLRNGFALVRPPGHHATRDKAMGFCIFNNVAIAALAARSRPGVERVAIVDFDVHHGNGTQSILEDDPNALYVSTHQYPFYPGTGGAYETGRGRGNGTTVNLPLPALVGDEGFKVVYSEILVPVLRRFQPHLILVSAGYDAHWCDPLAGLGLSLTGYAWICDALLNLAEELSAGKIVFSLEGGYDLDVLTAGVANSIRLLLGRTNVDDELGVSERAEPDITNYLELVKRIHLGAA